MEYLKSDDEMVKIRCTKDGIIIDVRTPTVLGPFGTEISVPYEKTTSDLRLVLLSINPEFSEDGSLKSIILDVVKPMEEVLFKKETKEKPSFVRDRTKQILAGLMGKKTEEK
jgi:hypothetical protein